MRTESCPECQIQPERSMPVAWGDGMQRLEVVPWLCASCGALAILHLPSGKLTATTDAEWEPVRRGNTELWQLIIETRALIRAGLEAT